MYCSQDETSIFLAPDYHSHKTALLEFSNVRKKVKVRSIAPIKKTIVCFIVIIE